MSLHTKQEEFCKALGDGQVSALNIIPSSIPADLRLFIHHHNCRSSLLNHLREGFPKTCGHLAPGAFDSLASEFIKACPPSSPFLLFYGSRFLEFAQKRLSDPGALSLLRLEGALQKLLQVCPPENAEVLALIRGLSALDLEKLSLELADSFHIMGSRYPLHHLWEEPGRALEVLPSWYFICSDAYGTEARIQPISEATFWFISELRKGEPLGWCCKIAYERDQDFGLPPSLALILPHIVKASAWRAPDR